MVWYHPGGIINILSLNNVQKNYRVTYDSSMKTGSVVNRTDCTNHVYQFTDVKCDIAHVRLYTVDSIKNK